MTDMEVLQSICGTDVDGRPKAQVGFYLAKGDGMDPDKDKELKKVVVTNAVASLYPMEGDMVRFDLEFPSDSDGALYRTLKVLDERIELMSDAIMQESEDRYYVWIQANPLETETVDGFGFLTMKNPFLHVLTASGFQKNVSTIRMIFRGDDFQVMVSDNVSFDDIDRKVEAEMREREAIEMLAAEEEQRKAEMQKNLGRK
jgi:hypothetical protein